MFKKINKAIVASSLVLAASTHSLVANAAEYSIEEARIQNFFTATFDGLVWFKAVSDDSTFFGNIPDYNNPQFGVNRSIQVIDPTNGVDASGSINWDGTTLTSFMLYLPDIELNIIDSRDLVTSETTLVQVQSSGAQLNLIGPFTTETGDANFNAGGDLGENSAISAGIFSRFTGGVVTSCIGENTSGVMVQDGGKCNLIPGLNLNPVRYTIEGTPAPGATLLLRAQTDNTSYYEVELVLGDEITSSSSKNVPAMGTFGLVALFSGLIVVAARLRNRVS